MARHPRPHTPDEDDPPIGVSIRPIGARDRRGGRLDELEERIRALEERNEELRAQNERTVALLREAGIGAPGKSERPGRRRAPG